jgi:pimeloyl-ACP methyl ester carboxylesterase
MRLSMLRLPLTACLIAVLAPAWATAQTAVPAAPAAPAAAPAAKPAATPSDKPLPPEQTSIVTRDGVQLHLTYFPSNRGKDAVPVILLHMFKGNRHEMEGLGLYLQKQGCAVVAPDLRGHGDSKLYLGKNQLEPDRIPPPQFANMVLIDMEAIKKFLIDKHNAGTLNVDKLCIVGAEMGASVGLNWAAQDWSAFDLPTLKQSKDVKAVVLISPRSSVKGLTLNKALAFDLFRSSIDAYLIAGAEDKESATEAKKIRDTLSRGRPKATKVSEETVFLTVDELKTKLVGTKLLGEQSLGVEGVIGDFINLRLAERPDLPWKERRTP